ncbi:MAG: hypothetical protein H7245_06865 [Candidatus Saccharibacteria bacterium]|nr:hypothetical protein [Pseudorhodobacter sp.]
MTDTTNPRAVDLLDQVYEALLRSDYGGLPGMTALLEQELLSPSAPLTEGDLAIIHRKATRNGACLLAAQRGVKAARRRLAEIRSTANGLVTYDRKGRRAEVIESRNLAQRL